VPALDSEIDTGYYDDFTSLDDMAKYAEVKEKQKNVERVKEKEEPFGRGVWVGFTFGKNNAAGQAVGRLAAQHSNADDESGSMATIF
jgi:cell cycle protein kinase DBF2